MKASAKSALLEINYECIRKVAIGQPFFIPQFLVFPQMARENLPLVGRPPFSKNAAGAAAYSFMPSCHAIETRCTVLTALRLGKWPGRRTG